jgi:hypothetical protein
LTPDEEFAEALQHLWANGLRARTFANGETQIFLPAKGPTTYRRLKALEPRVEALAAAEAKRQRKAAKMAARGL